jgi:hypothetical protein
VCEPLPRADANANPEKQSFLLLEVEESGLALAGQAKD